MLDLDSLTPSRTTQPPLHFRLSNEGALDASNRCTAATDRAACARLGAPCGWCGQTDAVQQSGCVAGTPARPCTAECKSWTYFARGNYPPPAPPPAPPPSPPGLSDEALIRHALLSLLPPQARSVPPQSAGCEKCAPTRRETAAAKLPLVASAAVGEGCPCARDR